MGSGNVAFVCDEADETKRGFQCTFQFFSVSMHEAFFFIATG